MKQINNYIYNLPSGNGSRPLSKREMQIFELANQPEKIIASCLFISRETVKNHMQSIRRKTGSMNKAEVWGLYQSTKKAKYIN